MKILNGSELASYIKERQLKQVRALRQSWRVIPRLAIVSTGHNPVIETYVRLKSEYGKDVMIEVDVYNLPESDLIPKIQALNDDENVHGVIVQLPLSNSDITESVIDSVSPEKDVDGLGHDSSFIPATAMAIDWLMAGYNITLKDKKISIVGEGRLVGAPLAKLWRTSGLNVSTCNANVVDIAEFLKDSDIVVTATGVPGLIKSEMIAKKATIVDAGTAAEHGKIIGDVAGELRDRQDINITPRLGGVGPLTVSALFDNVIQAARKVADAKGQQDNL